MVIGVLVAAARDYLGDVDSISDIVNLLFALLLWPLVLLGVEFNLDIGGGKDGKGKNKNEASCYSPRENVPFLPRRHQSAKLTLPRPVGVGLGSLGCPSFTVSYSPQDQLTDRLEWRYHATSFGTAVTSVTLNTQ